MSEVLKQGNNIYKIYFNGRKIGAIGILQQRHKEVQAGNILGAVDNLYDTYEHIQVYSYKMNDGPVIKGDPRDS